MPDKSSDSSANYVLLTRLADEFAARYRAGERPSLQEYLDRYPELADDIRDLFPTMVEIEQVKEDHQEVGPELTPPSPVLQQLGDYRIIREVGKGGMGIVYEAEQVSLGRHVALKLLPRNRLLDPQARQRFEREARSAARLHHTNIVPVFGVGEQDGLPYYVMQFIPGLGLDDVLEELKKLQLGNAMTTAFVGGAAPERALSAAVVAQSLLTGEFPAAPVEAVASASVPQPDVPQSPVLPDSSTPSSVRLANRGRDGSQARGVKPTYWQSVASIGVQVAEALEYAHKQGVQHRDIKPSNLLLDGQGTVWVADFGLAKADDQQNLTQTGDILGTLRYMPPEAFEGKTDARSDVYSLGLTLYELLAFRPAFGEKERNRLIKQVMGEEPTPLGQLNRQVPRDLETIVHKAIDKDPARRYATAGALAEDLQRYRSDEPILARRTTPPERLWRWSRRNPAVAMLTAAFLMALVAGLIGTTLQWQRAESHAARAHQREEDANNERNSVLALNDLLRRTNYASQMNLIQVAWEANNVGRVVQLLDELRPKDGESDLRGFEWHYWHRQCHGEIRSVSIPELSRYTENISLSADGIRVAAVVRGVTDKTTDRAVVWDGSTGKEFLSIPLSDVKQQGFSKAVLSRDGRRLVTISSNRDYEQNGRRKGDIRIWDVANGAELLHISPPQGVEYAFLHSDSISIDETRLVTQRWTSDYKSATLDVWDCSTGKTILSLSTPGIFGLSSFSSDGLRIAASVDDFALKSHQLKVWEVATGKELLR